MLKVTNPTNIVIAGPQSQRNWWSKIINPSEFKIWNPRSWKSEWRQKGEDADTLDEMDKVIENISDIDKDTSQIKGYFSQLKQYLPTNAIHEPKDWNDFITFMKRVQESSRKNAHQGRDKIIGAIFESINSIYESVRSVQINMNYLRQRPSIRGSARNKNDNIASPVESFISLDRVLKVIYNNPFNQEALFYAQRLHSRLEDQLRWITPEPDPQYDQWISEQENPQSQTQNIEQPVQNQIPQQQVQQEPINTNQNKTISEHELKDLIRLITDPPSPDGLTASQRITIVSMALWALIAKIKREGTDPMASMNHVLEELSAIERNLQYDQSPAQLKGPIQTETSHHMPEIPTMPDDNEFSDRMAISMNSLIKLADEIDKISPNLAKIIDDYIEEHANQEFIDLPEYGNILSET